MHTCVFICHVFCLFEEPANIRMQNNVAFYKDIVSQNEINGIVTPSQPQNMRPTDDYRATEEFDTYERLCRGEETMVSGNFSFTFISSCTYEISVSCAAQ